jgi:sugar phosphate permease
MDIEWESARTRRWVMWGILATAFFLMSFNRVTTGVLAEDLTRAFGLTATELSILHSSFFYVYAALQLPAGLLVDRYGPRRVSSTGIVVMSVGVCGFALSGSLVSGFLTRTLVGIGGSVIYLSILRFGANWFRTDEFATVVGISIALSGMGGLAATTPLALLVEAAGWRAATFTAGGVGLLLGGGVYLVVRDSPARAGLDPPRGVTSQGRTEAPDRETVLANTRRVLSSPDAWLLGVLLFLVIGTNLTILGLWGVPYLVHVYDLSVPRASTVVLVGSLGLVVGSPLFGWLSDRISNRLGFILAGSLVFTAGYGLIFVTGRPPLVVVAGVFFLANFVSGATALAYTLVKENHPTSASGVATGALNSLGYAGAAVVPAVMGVTLDAYWTGQTVGGSRIYSLAGYRLAFGFATLAGLVAVVCAVGVALRRRG